MKYVSVCSGIEAASVAWHGLGWQPLWFSEIEKFPSAVLRHHYPSIENRGDFTTAFHPGDTADLLVGGTPCQSFSVAGRRAGLDDARGRLALEYLGLAQQLGVRWLVWENVPGVLSQDGGRSFGGFLNLLGQCGYGYAYRVLDAQYFGVPQRRRRVFVIGHLGNWRRAAAVLFERESLRRDPKARRKAGEGAAAAHSRGLGSDDPAQCLTAHERYDTETETETFVSTIHATQDPRRSDLVSPALSANADVAVVFDEQGITSKTNRSRAVPGDPVPTLSRTSRTTLASPYAVRRLTPRERERLQGFPDDYTLIPGAKDGARNKTLGNSMAVPVMRWIGERIQAVENLIG